MQGVPSFLETPLGWKYLIINIMGGNNSYIPIRRALSDLKPTGDAQGL